MTGKSSNVAKALISKTKTENLKEKYGSSGLNKSLGAATLIGADLVDGFSTTVNLNNQILAIDAKEKEITARSDLTIAATLKQGDKAVGAQKAAFAKSGVKLQGTALDVLTETVIQASEAASARQREADFDKQRLAVAKAVTEQKLKYVPFDTALNIISSGASAFA